MKVLTGQFIIKVYDRYGSRIKDLDAVADALHEAEAIGDAFLKVADREDERCAASYTVDRRITNSLDSRARF